VFGGIEDRRNRSKTLLKVEQRLEIIIQAINRSGEGKEAALILIAQAIPCIMHLENRVGEKLMKVLLAMAAKIYRKKKQHNNNEYQICQQYTVHCIQSIVNTRILGSMHCPKHWKVPFNEKGDCINKVSFSNSKTRLFIDNLHVLISYVFPAPADEQQKETWLKLVGDYCEAMKILRKRSEFTEQDINNFQLKIDDFFRAYVEQSGAGTEGVTNYIHMLGSSHISYYMKSHGNLYKYSQQG